MAKSIVGNHPPAGDLRINLECFRNNEYPLFRQKLNLLRKATKNDFKVGITTQFYFDINFLKYIQ